MGSIVKVSIAIPTYECYGKSGEFLDDLLRTIEIQTFKDFEVCISDHSVNDDVLNVVNEFKDKFKIVFQKNTEHRGNGPANTNAAIDLCSGEIVKVMFQDDFFYDDEALEKIVNEMDNSDKMWLLNGSNHTRDNGHSFYWDLYPVMNDKLLEGVNTIGPPSVLSFRNSVPIRFDIGLVYFMDVEFYYAMMSEYGDPILYHDVLTTNRESEYSVTTNVSLKNRDHYVKTETAYCKSKHDIS
jgi:glycosyltransferase involved in cell wall biosynthesis